MVAPAAPAQATRLGRVLNVAVNGIATSCAEGGRVLDAIRSAGVKVPTLCYDERVGPKGTCRACLVEIELPGPSGASAAARKQTVAACTWFASDGMKVATHTDDIRDYRRILLELLLSETASPAGCPRCNTTGTCELHSACDEYGAKWDRFKRLTPRVKADDPNPFIQRDYDYCIACYRCTNICNEWEQAAAITVEGRGQQSKIASAFNNRLLESPCTFCGQCINTCPTGALSDRKVLNLLSLNAGQGGKTGPADLKRTKTICPYCGVGCGIHLLSDDGKLAGVEPDFTAPSRGSLCVKGQFASWEFVRSEDRLKYPLVRVNGGPSRASGTGPSRASGTGPSRALSPRFHRDQDNASGAAPSRTLRQARDGPAGLPAAPEGLEGPPAATFRRATWHEALDLVASRFKQTVARDGPDSVVCWASARVVTEANYLMQKFARVAIGTNNIDNCSRT